MAAKNKECWYKNVCQNECSPSCVRFIEMKYLMDNSGIPPVQQIPKELIPTEEDRPVFETLKKLKARIKSWVNSGRYDVFICSEKPGTAKTSWAIKLMLKYFDEIWSGNGLTVRGLFIHVPTLLQRLKDFNNRPSQEYIDLIKTCDLVIWDDIATASHLSEFEYTQLLILIDHRLLNNKRNIYTSNITQQEELDEAVGARLASRIYNSSKIYKFKGKDGRGGMQ